MSAPNLPRDSASPISITDQQSTTRTFETLLAELRAAGARRDPLPGTTEEEERWLRDYRSDLRSHDNDRSLVTEVLARRSRSHRLVLPHRSTLRTFETVLAEGRAAGARGDPSPELSRMQEGWLLDYIVDLPSDANDRILVMELVASRERRDAPPPSNYANAVPAERRPIEGEKCSICQDSFEDHKEEELQTCKVGRCGVTFHTECITSWFQSCQQRRISPTCPNCRRKWWF